MSKVLTTDKLITSLKRRALIPTNQATFTEQDFIDILNEEMDTGLIPYLLKQHEEHLVVFEDIPLVDDVIRYEIPYRAIGNKLRDVSFIDTAGVAYEMSRVSLEDISEFQSTYYTNSNNTFYIEGNEVVLNDISTNSTNGSLRFYYYLRPSELVKVASAGKITSIDRNTGVISLSNFPSDFSNLPSMDFVGYKTPNKIKNFDKTPTISNSTTKTVTFSPADIPANLIVGDYITIAEQSPVPQIPTELHSILAQRGAVHCLEALNDTEGLTNAVRKLDKMEASVMNVIEDRVEGSPQKINNRHSNLRQSLRIVKGS